MISPIEIARVWLPPALFSFIARWSGQALRWESVRLSWSETLRLSTGYDEDAILQRVVQATRAVVDGHAAYERDSVLFLEPSAPPHLLFPLLRHAMRYPGVLDVVDFGGSLGSTYRLCRPFLPEGLKVRWIVVEQPTFVAIGESEFSTNELQFVSSLENLPSPLGPRFILASSVLQYLENPSSILDALDLVDSATLVVERTPMWDGPVDQLTVQHVPPRIYPASYPCWIMSRSALLARWRSDWQVISDYVGSEGRKRVRGGPPFEFRSFILERKST